MINLELKLSGEELKKKLNIVDGKEGSPDTGEQIVDKVNELPTGKDDPKIDASHIKNLPEMGRRPIIGGGLSRGTADDLYVPYTGATTDVDLNSKSLLNARICGPTDDFPIKYGAEPTTPYAYQLWIEP